MGILLAFIPLIIILAISLGTVIITRRKFGTILPLVLMCICFAMLASQMLFGTFYVAYYLAVIAGIASIIAIITIAIKNKKLAKTIIKSYFSTGFAVCLITYIVFLLIFYTTNFLKWDNYSHWGPMAKEMLRLDKFYTIPESNVPYHKDYPPIVGLFEVFFSKFAGFREGILILSVHFLQFSVLLPAIEKIKKQGFRKGLAITLLAILATLFLDAHGIFGSIYVDYLLAFFGAFCLYIVFFEKINKFSIFYLLAAILFMTNIKEIAVALAGVTAFALLARSILESGRKHIFKKLIIPIAICLISLFGFFGWKLYIKDIEMERQFDLAKTTKTSIICPITRSCPENYRNEAARNYMHAIPSAKITTSWISLSYLQLTVLTILLYYLVYRKTKRKKNDKNRFIMIVTSYLVGSVLYIAAMFLIFTTFFDQNEGPRLASFNRYMNTYILLGFIVAIFYYMTEAIEKSTTGLFMLCVICVLIQSPGEYLKLMPRPINHIESSYANNLSEEIKDDETVIVYYHDLDRQNYFKYYALDYFKRIKFVRLSTDEETTDLDTNGQRFLLIDCSDEELDALQDEYGKEFQNGHIYSLE